MFLHVLVVISLPLPCSSRIDSCPSENVLYQRNTVARCTADTINFLNHFKSFCGIKIVFPGKTNRCTLFNCFLHYDLWYRQNRQVKSHCEYVPHYKRFELKLGMRGEEGLLMNFPKFHGGCATSTMFSQCCHKTYRTNLVLNFICFSEDSGNPPWGYQSHVRVRSSFRVVFISTSLVSLPPVVMLRLHRNTTTNLR